MIATSSVAAQPRQARTAIARDARIERQVEKILSKMTLEEKVGQMAEVGIDMFGNSVSGVAGDKPFVLNEEALQQIMEKYKVGSVLNAPGRAVERDHRAYQRGLDTLYGAADALRHRRHSRRYVYAPLAPVPAGDQRCGVVQPLYGARHGREDGLRSQGEQHPLDLFADYGSRPQGRMVARVGELRRGCLSVGRNGAPNGAGLSGRRPQPCRRQPCRSLHEALHGLRRSGQRQGPHTVVDNRSGHAREALRALSRNGKGGSALAYGQLVDEQRSADARQLRAADRMAQRGSRLGRYDRNRLGRHQQPLYARPHRQG